jgi:hypothetical protein
MLLEAGDKIVFGSIPQDGRYHKRWDIAGKFRSAEHSVF